MIKKELVSKMIAMYPAAAKKIRRIAAEESRGIAMQINIIVDFYIKNMEDDKRAKVLEEPGEREKAMIDKEWQV